MESTKNKILKESLNLFNDNGIANISLRMIAGNLNISLGNLNYHFNKRNDIVIGLYSEFSDLIDEKVLYITSIEKINAEEVTLFIKELMGLFFDYRFIFLDFSYIMRVYPTIRKSYKNMLKDRGQRFPQLFKSLVDINVLIDESYPDQYLFLYKRMQIITDFWLPYSEINNLKKRKETTNAYLKIILTELFPYFTEKFKLEITSFI